MNLYTLDKLIEIGNLLINELGSRDIKKPHESSTLFGTLSHLVFYHSVWSDSKTNNHILISPESNQWKFVHYFLIKPQVYESFWKTFANGLKYLNWMDRNEENVLVSYGSTNWIY